MLASLPDSASALSMNDALAKLKKDEEGRLVPVVFRSSYYFDFSI